MGKRRRLAWLGEGLATYADELRNRYEMSELAAHILEDIEDSAPPDSLATSFREYQEMIGYMLMESSVEFVIEKYGVEYLRNLREKRYDRFEIVFGKEMADIEQEWHEYMNGTYPNPDVPDRDELKKGGCK